MHAFVLYIELRAVRITAVNTLVAREDGEKTAVRRIEGLLFDGESGKDRSVWAECTQRYK